MHLQKVEVFEKPLPSLMPQGLKASDFVNLYQSAQNTNAKGLRFSGTAPGKVAHAGQSCRSRLRPAIPSGGRAPSYKRPRDRQQIVDVHPVRA